MVDVPAPDELDGLVDLIAAQQARLDRRITAVGVERDGIAAELAALSPPWAATARVWRDEAGAPVGVVIVELDPDRGRAWLIGPWAAVDDGRWVEVAGELLDAAMAQVPRGTGRVELAGDASHTGLATLAAGRGWAPLEAHHVLVVDAATAAAWPEGPAPHVLRAPTDDDVAGIAQLHDEEFPGTYATAAELVAGATDGSRVVFVADDGHGRVAGYVAGAVHADGEGFVDFVVVHPEARGSGLGRHLVAALVRTLLPGAAAGRVALTVQDHRTPARALYGRMGFRPDGVIVAYRRAT